MWLLCKEGRMRWICHPTASRSTCTRPNGTGRTAAVPWFVPASPCWLERHGTFHNTGSVVLSILMASEKFDHLHLHGFCVVGKYLLSLLDI